MMMMRQMKRMRRGGERLRAPAMLIGTVMAAAVMSSPAAAQRQPCDEAAGTLGIQGIRCEGCSYSMSESGIEEARFRTEPQVLAVVRGFVEGDALRAGDRIVALDGALITTREGSRKLVELRSGQGVTVRVRRDGSMRELEMVAGSACELKRRRERGELEVERIESLGFGPVDAPAPPSPPSPVAPPASAPRPGRASAPALPPLPARPPLPSPAPAPPPIGPSGYLGFGLRCTACGARDGELYFTAPPVIQGVVPGGPAGRAGLLTGDELLAVEGLDITTAPGATRFGAIEAGDTVRLRIRRGGAAREVSVVAGEAPGPRPARGAAPTAPVSDAVRYEGRLGTTRIEVRGAPVRVVEEADSVIVIRTADTVIRLRRGG